LEFSRGERRCSQISLQAGETNFTLRPFTISGETFGAFVRQLLQACGQGCPRTLPPSIFNSSQKGKAHPPNPHLSGFQFNN
jgi:hypothetical protein